MSLDLSQREGKVYVGYWDSNVYALDAETGREILRFKAGKFVCSSPAFADGVV